MFGPGKEIKADPMLALSGAFYAELLKGRDITEALTIGGVARPAISYASMSAVWVFPVALPARIKGAARESPARIKAAEGPQFDPPPPRFFRLNKLSKKSDPFPITPAKLL